jgi:inactivated superfamily I helicase
MACTQDIVNDLFAAPSGPLELAMINDSLVRKNKYVALYQLLDAVWKQNDAEHLEKIRAAFDVDADDLANEISSKINPAK